MQAKSETNYSQLLLEALFKFSPAVQIKNPVMFVVCLGALITLLIGVQEFFFKPSVSHFYSLTISAWLWLTVYFANVSEACAETRGRAQASFLRQSRRDLLAKKIANLDFDAATETVSASSLRKGDLIVVVAGENIPGDGEVVLGAAAVDESAITGESAPVIREAGGDRSSVTGGTKIISDRLVIRITANPGETFLDQMISMIDGAKRRKTPNETALIILLVSLTIVFVLVSATLLPFSEYSVLVQGQGSAISITNLVALLVCLAPTTIGGLTSAIGISGMNRLHSKNVLALSGRAVEAAGDVDVLLLDKTGTITYGNRQAVNLISAPGVRRQDLLEAALLSSLADETPEGRSIIALVQSEIGGTTLPSLPSEAKYFPFSAETRMSGVDLPDRSIRKGAVDAVLKQLPLGEVLAPQLVSAVDRIARNGGTPLLIMDLKRAIGCIELKDIVKPGIRERFSTLRQMGIKTIMVTGDNPLTAATIAAEAGVDDFLAESTPERKLQLIRSHQSEGKLVAMMGDGTNDSPALAQADVAIAMNSGTQAAKEAANMIDLDSNPTKLLEVVEVGKQLLITRGALTTFSIANDVAKYFAIVPAAFVLTYPELKVLDIMNLTNPNSAILAAVIFNTLIIPLLTPLALKGVKYRPIGAAALLRNNLLIYGLGGLVVPFIGIKVIDLILATFI